MGIGNIPTGMEPGLLHYCDNETGAKDEIAFRVAGDKSKLLAWSATASGSPDQVFPIVPLKRPGDELTDNEEIYGMEIQFDSENTAMFVIPPPEPTYWPSEEVSGVDMPK